MLLGEKQWIPPSPQADQSAQTVIEAHNRGYQVSWTGQGEIQVSAPMLLGEKQWIAQHLEPDQSAQTASKVHMRGC
jgi:hypothetical protein